VNTSPVSKIALLRERARMLAAVRAFFAQKQVLEVDCPALSKGAPIDQHIDIMIVNTGETAPRYLHSSPEYGMKRLLALGCGDIYQLSHVFRSGEHGKLHNPEFTMIEWYRVGMTFHAFISEVANLIKLFLGPLSLTTLTYREAFLNYCNLDYVTATPQELRAYLTQQGAHLSTHTDWDKDSLLSLILTTAIEPHLGQDTLTLLTDFPASQAALAQTRNNPDGEIVAERFEFYYKGIELGNGYHELTDPSEQRKRLLISNEKRINTGKKALPVDEFFATTKTREHRRHSPFHLGRCLTI
jgi:lysyl-tRNA synthetase class 2